jgi:outer membrane receptor for ferric coprogen and ferric-rhodotorulic acid
MRQDGETYNHGPNKKLMVAPSLTWNLASRTKLSAMFMYYVPNLGTSRTPWFSDSSNTVSTFLSRRTSLDDHDESRKHWVYASDLNLEHAFSDAWQLRVVGRFTSVDENKFNYNHTNFRFIGQNGAALLTPAGANATYLNYTFAQAFANPLFTDIQIDRTRRRDRVEAERIGFYADLVGDLEFGPTKHKLITSAQKTVNSTDTKQFLWNYPSTSVFNPVIVTDPGAVSTAFRVAANNIAWAEGWAVGSQDNLSMLEQRLNLVVGARYDSAETKTLNRITNVRTDDKRKQGSYRLGGLYKVIPAVAVFGNWSQTFIPLSGLNLFGEPFKNQTGAIKEAGLKTEAFRGRLTGTFSVFDLKLDNATRQIVNVQTGIAGQVQSGFIKSRGYEMDLGYQPIDEFTLIAGLGNLRSKDEKGIQARGVSQGVNWKIFGKYNFLRGPAKGFTAGLGYVFNNKSAADGNGVIILPSYHLWDGLIGYGKDRWRVQLNVSNLADKVYAAGGVSNQFIAAGRPREYKGTFNYRF